MEVGTMLVLSRREGESIEIAGGIRITVSAIRGQKISLGIEAPRDVVVRRSELAERDPANQVGDSEDSN